MSRSQRPSPPMVVGLLGVMAVVGLLNGCSGVSGRQAQTTQIQDQLVSVDGQTWVVGTHLVTVSSDASVNGSPSVGDQVVVSGRRTDAGELVIDNVQVLADAQPASTPVQDSSATSARPATATTPPDHGNQADKADKGDKSGKGHKGN
jgi:hypothetical protein